MEGQRELEPLLITRQLFAVSRNDDDGDGDLDAVGVHTNDGDKAGGTVVVSLGMLLVLCRASNFEQMGKK